MKILHNNLKFHRLHIQIETLFLLEKIYIKNCYFKSVFITIAAPNQMLEINISTHKAESQNFLDPVLAKP